MKKLFFALAIIAAMFATTTTVQAQLVQVITSVKDSTKNADNAIFTFGANATYKGVEVNLTKESGTIAGKAVLEGQLPSGANWAGIDSITLTDVAYQYKLFTLPAGQPHLQYRIKVTETGTGEIDPIKVYTIRRTDQ